MTTLVKDPMSGTFMAAPGTRSIADLTGTNAAPTMDPYSVFNKNLASMLVQIRDAQTAGTSRLGGARDFLTTESVAPGGPQPFNPNIGAGSQIAGQEALRTGFTPAITSVNTQLENTNTALAGLRSDIGTLATVYQPKEVSPGTSLVTPGGTTIKQGHQYQPQVNPYTGLLDGFDINTGTWASNDQSSGTTSSVVGGVDLSGAATSTQPYATDPNYSKAVGAIYKNLGTIYPQPSADTVDQYIAGHARSSPVTGQMVMNAATQYNIDPNLLTAVLAQESDFGTAGAGAKTMNPGNVGNTGTSTRNYNSWMQGVNATAAELARRAVPTTDLNTVQNVTSPVGGRFSTEASTKVQALPVAYQSYVDAGPLGIAYINSDRVPDNVKQGLQTMASRAGIPFTQPADVGAIKSIETVLSNLDSMQKLATDNLMSGVPGRVIDATVGRGAEILQTNWGRQLGLFDNYRDVAIKAVQALAGGAGSGLRINMGEIAANVQNLPQASNNLENAIVQIQQFKLLIYTQMATTFPYARVNVADSKGKVNSLPIGQLNEAIKQGYKVQ